MQKTYLKKYIKIDKDIPGEKSKMINNCHINLSDKYLISIKYNKYQIKYSSQNSQKKSVEDRDGI